MNQEIEEIIEYFRNDIKWLEEEFKNSHYLGKYITIRDKEYEYLKQLLDYITNLQEENKELNRMCELYSKSLYNADLTKAEIKIDKAIKQLDNIKFCVKYNKTLCKCLTEIQDILRGKDNESN